MDTPRTPRDNLRTSPGLEDLEDVGRLEAPLLPHARPAGGSHGGGRRGSANELPAVAESKRCVHGPCIAVDGACDWPQQLSLSTAINLANPASQARQLMRATLPALHRPRPPQDPGHRLTAGP